MSLLRLSAETVAAVARSCFGAPNLRLSTPREQRFRRRGSVSVNVERGVFRDHEAGVGGGVLAMLIHAGHAQTSRDAARILENLGELHPRESFQERWHGAGREQAELARRRASAASLWALARPLAGTIAETYLRDARGIAVRLDRSDLQFLPEAPYRPLDPKCRDHLPAMVARVNDASGRGIGAHLTYLRCDGSGKAEVDPARKCVGVVAGGFVRLAPGRRLILAEGIESALSAWQARPPEATDFGAVAAISAGGLSGLVWPPETEALIVAPDADKPGEQAAQALARRAHAAGIAVSFMRPPEGFGDWNDAAQAGRRP